MTPLKHYTLYLLAILGLALAPSPCQANDWTIHASYHNATKAVKVGSTVFVLANGNLYSYDTDDSSLHGYDKSNVLTDFGIRDIAWCTAAKRLVVLYENGNIDLVGLDGSTLNVPDIKRATIGDKTINELTVVDGEALVSLNSGLVRVSVGQGYIIDRYPIGAVRQAIVRDGKIYARTGEGVMVGDCARNLLDTANWASADWSDEEFAQRVGLPAEAQEADELLEQMRRIVPDSPEEDWAYKLAMTDEGRLLVAGGTFYYPDLDHPGKVMMREGGRWSAFDEESAQELGKSKTYVNVTDVVQDPADPSHHWVGSKTGGLYEFRDFKCVSHYDSDNSPITTILPDLSTYYRYNWLTGLAIDGGGNLWMLNCHCDTVVRILRKDGRWKAYHYPEVAYYETLDHTMFDSRGWAWINSRRTTNTNSLTGVASRAGLLVVDTDGTIDTQADDRHRFITSFYNQNGQSFTPNLYYCAVEDLDGAVWVGCTEGLFMTSTPEEVFNNGFTFTQPIVPRNDGSGLGDYLLDDVPVKCIAIDGGNRKWVGTLQNGVYLLSADGMTTIHHFTADNSPLISDAINDIAIDGETGEVYIATAAGLCSFHGDATDPAQSMESSSLKVFPNPVRPEYNGDVHITGLTYNSDVKIVSAAGRLVAQGKSVGGEFSWDCANSSGRRVSSGIYYALCTDENGNKGAVAKILIIR